MTTPEPILPETAAVARRTFSAQDQDWFAALSGDFNPLHVDPLYARRTAVGRPVVHGIHLLAWALDAVAPALADGAPVNGIDADFVRFVHPDEPVSLDVGECRGKVELRIVAAGAVRCRVTLRRGPLAPPKPYPRSAVQSPEPTARACNPERIEGSKGAVRFAGTAADWGAAFPGASALIGSPALAALGGSTRLVGMLCPGLHSLYLGLSVTLSVPADEAPQLDYVMSGPRHGLVQAEVAAPGLHGHLRSLLRAAPREQPSAAMVAPWTRARLDGDRVLVVGGSRGLGELTAKMVAAAGAQVMLTYHRGEDGAAAVAAEIRAAGGLCTTARLDVTEDAARWRAALSAAPTQVYYYATPIIADPHSRFLDEARLDELLSCYVRGFARLAAAVRAACPDARLFYPSTVFLNERRRGMGEYAVAKAAGEQLAHEINATMAPLEVVVRRLPMLPTDQTADADPHALADPIATLAPVISTMHRRDAAAT